MSCVQVWAARGAVEVNQLLRGPLLEVIEQIEERFLRRATLSARCRSACFGYRSPTTRSTRSERRSTMPWYIATTLGWVALLQWHQDHLLITNPGGFPEGVTIENLLVHEPKPRNVRLAEAFKRIGLVEHTGRGIDKIYLGQLRYGRPLPDYTRSDDHNVRVVLRGGEPSLHFAAFVYEEDRQGRMLSLDELIVLNTLFFERRTDSAEIGKRIEKGPVEGRAVLERLQERGLVERRGEGRGRGYHLSAQLYRKMKQPESYDRVHGIDAIRTSTVLEAVRNRGKIVRAEVARLCSLSDDQASRLLKKMTDKGLLARRGKPPRWVPMSLETRRLSKVKCTRT